MEGSKLASRNTLIARKFVSPNIHSLIFAHKLVHRKGWGTCRSPKRYNLSLDCPPCLVLFKMADKISMSQRALPKVASQRYI